MRWWWALVLACLLSEAHLAHVGVAFETAEMRHALDEELQHLEASIRAAMDRKVQFLYSIANDPTQFIQYPQHMESQFASWISQHSTIFNQCYSGSMITEHVKERLAAKMAHSFPLDSTTAASVQGIVKSLPVLSQMSQVFKARPDWALTALQLVDRIPSARSALEQFRSWAAGRQAQDQTLLELQGNVIQETSTGVSGMAMGSLGTVLRGDSSKDFTELSTTISGAPAGMGVSGSMVALPMSSANTLNEFLAPLIGQVFGSSGTSQGSIVKGLGSSTTFPGMVGKSSTEFSGSFGMLELESTQSGSDQSMYSSALQGSDTGSIASIGSSASSQGMSAPDEPRPAQQGPPRVSGCCAALSILIMMLGVGLGGEYCIHNMHKIDGDKYVKNLEETMALQRTQLMEFLERDATTRKKLEAELDKNPTLSSFPQSETPLFRLPFDFRTMMTTVESQVKAQEQRAKPSGPSGSRTSDEPELEPIVDEDSVAMTGKPLPARARPQAEAVAGVATTESGKPDPLGQVMMIFYMGYSAIPAIISRQFGFYLCMMTVAVVLSVAAQGGA